MLTYEEYLKQQQAQQANGNDLNVDQAIGAMRAAGQGGIEPVQTPVPSTSPATGQTAPADYGLRNDGTRKGSGWLGPINLPNGNVATEYSIGVDFDGKETEIPTLVPTLTEEEIALMRDDIIPNNKPVPMSIQKKAVEHAISRMREGKSVWADENGVAPSAPTSPAPGSDYQATMDRLGKDYTDAVNANAQDWQDYVLGIAKRNEEAEAEMRRQEEASRKASAFTGVTEVAANIANLLSVGQGHATPQKYNTYSQGWMQKADQDMRERRRHTENMRGQMDRLNYQIQQVKNADRLGDIKFQMEAAKEAERKRLADEDARKKQAAADAAEQEKIAARDATMLRSGFVPDANDPSGYRFDADLARQMAEAKKAPKAAGSAGTKAAAMPAASPAAKPQATSRVVTPPAAARQSAPAPASDTTKVTKPAQATEASGNGNRRYNRTTFLPPTQKDWERGIDKRNSPQGRKKVGGKPEQKKDDWDQFKIK